MMVLAARTFADHHNGHDAAGLHLPVQHGAVQDINKVVPALADAPCKTGRRFGVGPFATSFRSGRVPPSLAIRMARGAAPNLPASLASLFRDFCDHFPKRAHRAGAVTPYRQEILKRQAHLASNLCRAALHRVVLSKFLICWINKYQQARTINWEIQTSFGRAI